MFYIIREGHQVVPPALEPWVQFEGHFKVNFDFLIKTLIF